MVAHDPRALAKGVLEDLGGAGDRRRPQRDDSRRADRETLRAANAEPVDAPVGRSARPTRARGLAFTSPRMERVGTPLREWRGRVPTRPVRRRHHEGRLDRVEDLAPDGGCEDDEAGERPDDGNRARSWIAEYHLQRRCSGVH